MKSDNETKRYNDVMVEFYDRKDLDNTEAKKLNCMLTKDVKLKDYIESLFSAQLQKKK